MKEKSAKFTVVTIHIIQSSKYGKSCFKIYQIYYYVKTLNGKQQAQNITESPDEQYSDELKPHFVDERCFVR